MGATLPHVSIMLDKANNCTTFCCGLWTFKIQNSLDLLRVGLDSFPGDDASKVGNLPEPKTSFLCIDLEASSLDPSKTDAKLFNVVRKYSFIQD